MGFVAAVAQIYVIPSGRGARRLLFVQIQLTCGAVRIILLSVNASRDDLEPK